MGILCGRVRVSNTVSIVGDIQYLISVLTRGIWIMDYSKSPVVFIASFAPEHPTVASSHEIFYYPVQMKVIFTNIG